ncbi:MAG: patatin-like phospholipase family protein [candidate division WOR-3 bacterium]|nr:patatin-like phospholipase family protein [candidate division WOR-3 bacterium]
MDYSARKTPKIGLALGSGAARGLAHIGVLKALEEESIPINIISGTSMGAIVGAYYAKEGQAAILEEVALGIDWKKLARLLDLNLALLQKGFVHGYKVKEFLQSLIGDVKFEDLEIPLAVVAADAETTEEIIITKGSVVEAVRASISMPGIFTPVKWQDRFLIDGGVVNPVPADVARNMGAEIVIAVNVIPGPSQGEHSSLVKKKETSETKPAYHLENTRLSAVKRKIDNLVRENKDKFKLFEELSNFVTAKTYEAKEGIEPGTPNIFDVLMQSLHAMEYEIIRLRAKTADIVINPDVSNIGAFQFYKGEELIPQGYKAARDVLPQLQEMIHSVG